VANQPLRQSEKDCLQYIASMTNELLQLSEASRFPMVAYFLGMAYAEVFDVLRGGRPARQLDSKFHYSERRPKAARVQSRGA
jgi:hypothetical protein